MKKVIVITGSSSGLGLSLAVKLAKQHTVYATMRDIHKQTALQDAARKANIFPKIRQLDVQSTESVNACVADIIKAEGKIDCLVNNAGAGFVRSTEQATEQEIQWVMDVNFMGVVRCTKAVLPFMREVRSGHIINISSVAGLVGQPFNEVYCAAKFAVEGYTESMATYIQSNFKILFTLVEPGGIKSEFTNTVLKKISESGGMYQDDYLPILEKYINNEKLRSNNAYQSAAEVADVVVNCINSEKPPLRVRTSEWARQFCDLKTRADTDGHTLTKKVMELYF